MKNKVFFMRAAAAVLIFMLISLSGCGQEFDAADYVQAMLDAAYKGDDAAYTRQDIGSSKEARKMYENNLNTLVDSFEEMLGSDLDDEQKSKLTDSMRKVCSSVRYDVGEMNGSGEEYHVKLTVEPLQFSTVLQDEEFNAEAEKAVKSAIKKDPDTDDSELMAALTDILIERFGEIADDPTYDEKKTIQVQVVKNSSGAYEISGKSWKKIDQALIR